MDTTVYHIVFTVPTGATEEASQAVEHLYHNLQFLGELRGQNLPLDWDVETSNEKEDD